MIRCAVAAGVLLIPSAASADIIFTNGQKIAEFPSCEVTVETRYGPAKVERTLSEGAYLYQNVSWRGVDAQKPAGFVVSPWWRNSRTSGLAAGPVFDVGLQKGKSTILSRSLALGSKLTIRAAVPDAASVAIIYGPLQDRRSKYRDGFNVDVVDLVNRFQTQEHVILEIEEPARRGDAEIHRGKLSLNSARAFLQIDSEANRLLDEWQSGGGVNCPGESR